MFTLHCFTIADVHSNAALQVEIARQASCINKDQTAENLKKLVVLSSSKSVDYKRAQKVQSANKIFNHMSINHCLHFFQIIMYFAFQIFDRTVKNKKPVSDTPQSSSSVFTEEDFQKFEEEYFIS